MSSNFCSKLENSKDIWSSKKWSCDTSQSLIAFRYIRTLFFHKEHIYWWTKNGYVINISKKSKKKNYFFKIFFVFLSVFFQSLIGAVKLSKVWHNFRVCRATCGFCNLDWKNAPEANGC